MDTNQAEKKAKPVAKASNSYATLRVKKDTRKRVVNDLKKVNDKEFGRKLRVDEYISFALNFVTEKHRTELQNSTLSHQDRLNRDYKAYVAEHGMISKDEYLGKRLTGEIISPKTAAIETPRNG